MRDCNSEVRYNNNKRTFTIRSYYAFRCRISKPLACICTLSAACHTATHTHMAELPSWRQVNLTVSVSWLRLWTATRGTLFPSHIENAAEAVLSTLHSCLPTTCLAHCSPAHANQCPFRLHRLITLWQTFYTFTIGMLFGVSGLLLLLYISIYI